MPSIFSAIGDLMKRKPQVPRIKPIDVGAEQGKAIGANIGALPEIQRLASAANAYGREEATKDMDAFLGAGTREQIEDNIAAAARGELPDDVAALIERRAAERSMAGGYGGSVAASNLGLRDLGLVSLQRSDYALDAASRWISTAREGMPQFNYASMFVTPEMFVQQANMDRSAMFQRQWMKNQLDAAYAPMTIIGENTIKYDEQMSAWADMAVASYLGGGGGMGGGGGGGGGGMGSMASMASMFSDRNAKKDFEEVDHRETLALLTAFVPVTRWRYKQESEGIPKHMGPMAQDFKGVFYPGRDETQISLLELSGVVLSAIHGLNQKLDEANARIAELEAREFNVPIGSS